MKLLQKSILNRRRPVSPYQTGMDRPPISAGEIAVEFTRNLGYRLVKSWLLSKTCALGSGFLIVRYP